MAKRHNPYRGADRHTRAAKAAGYVARSVFKLQEIDKRIRLLKAGQHVLDLGAAPGSWSAYAAEKIGPRGALVAIDLQPLRQVLPQNCHVLQGDAFDDALLTGLIGEHAPYDVVLSDMAPNTTGDRRTDKIRSQDLFERALGMATKILKPGGGFVGKLFMSGTFADSRKLVRTHFETARTMRPEAVRDVSYEVYLVGLGFRGLE